MLLFIVNSFPEQSSKLFGMGRDMFQNGIDILTDGSAKQAVPPYVQEELDKQYAKNDDNQAFIKDVIKQDEIQNYMNKSQENYQNLMETIQKEYYYDKQN